MYAADRTLTVSLAPLSDALLLSISIATRQASFHRSFARTLITDIISDGSGAIRRLLVWERYTRPSIPPRMAARHRTWHTMWQGTWHAHCQAS